MIKFFEMIFIAFFLFSCSCNARIENKYFENIENFSIENKYFQVIESGNNTDYFKLNYGDYNFFFVTSSGIECNGEVSISKINLRHISIIINEDGTSSIK